MKQGGVLFLARRYLGVKFVKKISLLGATGSIGIQTLDVIKEHPEEFKLVDRKSVVLGKIVFMGGWRFI